MNNLTEKILGPPQCKSGYPQDQLRIVLSPEEFQSLMMFMNGQTMTICEGRLYNHEERKYEPSGCGPHGGVVYPHDIARWLRGLPAFD